MRIHLIAIGGSIMHNLAISLQKAGHTVSGSDDEIYEPARSRLQHYSLLPDSMGWNPTRITPDIDMIILGMHARKDNPELLEAQSLCLRVASFPEFVAEQTADKKRVVIAGSHGKTTTTSMIMHVLNQYNYDFDYLVGAQLAGFDDMVKLSDAPWMIIEGDEYLSSAIDSAPKIWHYKPHIAVITGIAWDHMNVFPTMSDYIGAFEGFLDRIEKPNRVFYFADDERLASLVAEGANTQTAQGYKAFPADIDEGKVTIVVDDIKVPLQIFGNHNLANLRAAYEVLTALGVSAKQFSQAITSFTGASKRLQPLVKLKHHTTYQDFAHAPSKVAATIEAVHVLHPDRRLTACVELHTYSSLNHDFLPQYRDTMSLCDRAIVYFSEHTLSMKKMPPLSEELIKEAFGREDLLVFTDPNLLEVHLSEQEWHEHNLLFMSSGTFGGLDLQLTTSSSSSGS